MRITDVLLARNVGYWSKQYSNLPERYIKRAMEQVYWKNPVGIEYKPDTRIERKKYRFTMNRPWTGLFYHQNSPGTMRQKVFVEPIRKWSFFRGDRVEVLVGKNKGKQGFVKQIIEERNWVVVEGLNCHLKKMGSADNFGGVYVQSEAPLLVTNQVALVDPSDFKSTPFEWRFTEDGHEVRVSTRTGRIIPVPAEETIDYKTKGVYKEQPKDTPAKEVEEITFNPVLRTFEMDIMEQMGIKEDKVPAKTWWY